MKNVKRYSQMWVSIMVIVLAGYVGICSAEYVLTWGPAGKCNAYHENGTVLNSSNYGCCIDEGPEGAGYAIDCASSYNKCAITWNGNTRTAPWCTN
jgi:hypothetical protein